ncbi:hypothetical protein [Nitrosomonas mobilis]|uniref:hypothetical protein n=1 Tax=Nitrosomonas mobilis TaxID=51642 RepID=UPI001C40B7C1|nr:hypothetical protein [Nitrosomonas mobilis]
MLKQKTGNPYVSTYHTNAGKCIHYERHRSRKTILRIPVQPGHAFHGKLDSHSRANWTLIPRQTGQ